MSSKYIIAPVLAFLRGGTTVLLLADPAPNRSGFHPSSAATPKPGPAKPRSSTAANSRMMECSALLRIKTMRAMFRAADEQIPPTAARP